MHRASSSSSRHRVWLVALAGLLVLPLIATYAPVGVLVLPPHGQRLPGRTTTPRGHSRHRLPIRTPATQLVNPNGRKIIAQRFRQLRATTSTPPDPRTSVPLGTPAPRGVGSSSMLVLLGRL